MGVGHIMRVGFLAALVACHDRYRTIFDGIDCCPPDLPPPPPACDPLAQDCGPTERCTWFDDDALPAPSMGHAGCAPITGSEVGEGQSCTFGFPPNGYDNCEAGFVCAVPAGMCRRICDLNGTCPTGTCVVSGVFFTRTGTHFAGVCE